MTVYFFASEVESFSIVGDSSLVTGTTNANLIDTTYSRAGFRIIHAPQVRTPVLSTPLSDVWVHIHYADDGNDPANDDDPIFLHDTDSAQDIARFTVTNDIFTFQYWNGSGYTSMAGAFDPITNTGYEIDIHVKIATTGGVIAWYLDGIEQDKFEGNTDFAGLLFDQLRLRSRDHNTTFSGDNYFSQIIIADEPTLNCKVATLEPTADGATSGWTSGSFADIDDVGVPDNSDFISSDTANQVETFVTANTPAPPPGFVIKAVAVGAYGRRSESGPQNIQAVIRSGGTDYVANLDQFGIGFDGRQAIFATDPDTGTDWTESGVNALEHGVKSIA